ncbi:hypothetical protein MSBR3_0097 [Methanosarcina barkeri 3]|uniref:Uncharacterized protein n=1 Tax=Methanosarcina barkeri 3 TaxID=1434107 RepID=A0A0E3WX02_METBA|nr:hypothetical protein [Methanosarcina barkeri]AKB80675.1 hypothetical protein MSBR3_0097 [Methanosarcina barkeri 3]
MGSKITFNNIVFSLVKKYGEVTDSERKSGKLQAGSVASKLTDGKVIDVLVLKKEYPEIRDESVTFNEADIRKGTRRQFTELAELYRRKGRLPVHTDFFKNIQPGDIVIIMSPFTQIKA